MNISVRNGDGRETMHTALKIFKRSSLQRLKILSVLGDSAYIFLAL
jgi:ribosomal protein S21